MIGIYKITSPTKKVYIGQSVNIEKRFKRYVMLDCKKQPAIYRSLLKYGVNKHKFEILCECDITELNDKERYYQDIFSAAGKNGLNCMLTASSDRSGKLSNETKKKLSEAHKGKKHSKETCLKISKSNKGRICTKESKLKYSNAKLGKKLSYKQKINSTESRKKIILNTQTGIFYLGNNDAAESININRMTLYNYLIGKRKNKTPFIYV